MSDHSEAIQGRVAVVVPALHGQWGGTTSVEAELVRDQFACLEVAACTQLRACNVEIEPEIVLRMMQAARDAMTREIDGHKARN